VRAYWSTILRLHSYAYYSLCISGRTTDSTTTSKKSNAQQSKQVDYTDTSESASSQTGTANLTDSIATERAAPTTIAASNTTSTTSSNTTDDHDNDTTDDGYYSSDDESSDDDEYNIIGYESGLREAARKQAKFDQDCKNRAEQELRDRM
jgi:hypothetical protein